MYPINSQQEISSAYQNLLQSTFNEFLSVIGKSKENILLHATEDLFADSALHGFIYHITAGSYSWNRDEELCFVVEQGDVIGIEEMLGLKVGRYASEFAVRCDRYSFADIKKVISDSAQALSLWNSFLGARCTMLSTELLQALRGEKPFVPEIRSFAIGETVIKQGTVGREVYTLLNGHAEVVVDGVKVGEILCDEIFGALAALTDMSRTASVITTQDSTVLSIEREKFLELIEHRPLTVLKMVQDMARTIVDLNKKVVEKSQLYR